LYIKSKFNFKTNEAAVLAVFYYLEKVKMAEPVSSGAGAVAIKMYGIGAIITVVIALGFGRNHDENAALS
jgi:hypothetical protein